MGGCSFLYFKYNILAAPKQAFLKKSKKVLAIYISLLYNNPCCDIDSVEAEVAAQYAGHFVERMSIKNNWRQVTVLISSVIGSDLQSKFETMQDGNDV